LGFKKWKLPQTAPERVENLISQTGMERIAAQILDGRGISDPQQAVQYIGCDSAARLHDPFLMQDMDKAVERLSEAVEQGEQIAVYGDYDCDGITATAMLYSYLEDLGARVIYYIPDRDVEGYGLNRAALDFLKEQQVELIVTGRCTPKSWGSTLSSPTTISRVHSCRRRARSSTRTGRTANIPLKRCAARVLPLNSSVRWRATLAARR